MIVTKFIEDYAPSPEQNWKAGDVVELSEDVAAHCIKRRKAIAVNGEIPTPPVPKAPDSSLTDRAEARHQARRRPVTVTGYNTLFERGDDE